MRQALGGWTVRRLVVVAGSLLTVYPPNHLAAQCPDGSPPPCRAQSARAAPAPPSNSIAVLYFDNLSRDTADAYLADGLTEELIVRLGQLERLVVKSRAAVERYRSDKRGPAELGRAVGAAHLLNGSVRRAAGRLRVTVELVRAATGDHVWGDRYDRTDGDLLAIQDDIARAVATAIAGRLIRAEQAALGARRTHNPSAYDHFLRGDYALAQRTPQTAARAISEYAAAVRLDPAFTAARARVAYAYALFLDWGWDYPGLPRDSILARGLVTADSGLSRDSTVSDAWMARAYLLTHRHPRTFESVVPTFQRAIELNPRNAEAHHQLGWVHWLLGDDSGAVAAYHRALTLDPERAITLEHLARLDNVGRRYEEARKWIDSALAVDPSFAFGYLARARLRRATGELAGAREDAEKAVRLGAPTGQSEVVVALLELSAGDTLTASDRLRRVLRNVPGSGPVKVFDAEGAALALIALRDTARALDLLERAYPRGGLLGAHLRMSGFDPLRSHAGFQRVVEESRPR